MTRYLRALLCATALLLITAAVPAPPESQPRAGNADTPPNIVFILADDLSKAVTPYMSELAELAGEGVSFEQFITSNSQCCPSRTTMFTGKYPHNHEVLTNTWPLGGFGQFLAHGYLDDSLSIYLKDAGYRTGLLGKYLNQYQIAGDTDGVDPPDYPRDFVPPGWDEWFAFNGSDRYFDYTTLDGVDGVTDRDTYGTEPEDYRTDVLGDRASEFLERSGDGPFFLLLTPNAVHSARPAKDLQQPDSYRFPPAPRDRSASPNRPPSWGEPEFELGDCGDPVDGGCAPLADEDARAENFNVIATDAPKWAPTEPMTEEEVATALDEFVQQVQMAQGVDDLLGRVRDEISAAGLADNTYVFFGSDNGYHLGEHALRSGKQTAYDHDVRLPFIVAPPGGTTPTQRSFVASNVDVLPTLLDIAGVTMPPVDGQSLEPMITDSALEPVERATLIEHEEGPEEAATFREDPDSIKTLKEEPTRYMAFRTSTYLYVDYSTLDTKAPGERNGEFYDLLGDPFELTNLWPALTKAEKGELNDYLGDYAACEADSCRELSFLPPAITP